MTNLIIFFSILGFMAWMLLAPAAQKLNGILGNKLSPSEANSLGTIVIILSLVIGIAVIITANG